jgi:urate oxidase
VPITLGDNRYGKAEVRLVRVVRDAAPHDGATPGEATHELVDLNVSVALAGDLAGAHLRGDNSTVLPTDTQKNTVYAFAADGVGAIEDFGLRLARHFVGSQPSIHRALVTIERYPWTRLGRYSFQRSGSHTRVARITVGPTGEHVVSGVRDLVLLNTTASEFVGFVRDEYTTLPEATDRVLATAVSADWRHASPTGSWDSSFAGAVDALTGAFVNTYSAALQQTLFSMGSRVLETRPELVEVRLSLPNRHHFLVDLTPFGLANPGEVFHADDRPYGLIEGTVLRDDVPEQRSAWTF